MKKLTPKVMLEYCRKRIMGQDSELKKAVYMIYQYMRHIADGSLKSADSWMLTAPSGSGKTEFFRAIRDLFSEYKVPIPVVQIDLSRITEEGFKGDNASIIPSRILSSNPELNGIGICFLDEADKKCVPSYSSKGNANINAAIQSNLLTLVEGIKLAVDVDGITYQYDSSNTMFIFMGAFQDVRNEKADNKNRSVSMGFGAVFDEKDSSDEADSLFYEDLTMQDIIDYGMLEELAGRMVQLVNFHRLSQNDMRMLIRCKTAEISEELGYTVELTEQAEEAVLEVSFGTLGIRRPINLIKSLAQNAVADVFFDDGFDVSSDKVVITSLETAVAKKKYSVKLNETRSDMCNEGLCILRDRQAVG